MSNGWKKYTQNQLSTSSTAYITTMVYEKCILNIKTMQTKLKENDLETVQGRLINTEQLLNELMSQLDHDGNPEIAGDLASLYEWSIGEVRLMGIRKDPELGNAIINVLENLLEGFREAMKKNEG